MDPDQSGRLHPSWFNHQRHVLKALAQAVVTIVQEHQQPLKNATVLDFGCGDAPYRTLFQACGIAKYLAADLGEGAEIPIESGKPLPIADHSIDFVVSFQVLEHVWNLDWYLSEVKRVLKPDGRLILSTHGTWLYHPHPTDFRRWTVDGLSEELRTRGLIVDKIEGLVGPLAWTTQVRLLGYRMVCQKIPLVGNLLASLIALLMNVRMSLEDGITPPALIQNHACVYITVSHPPGVS